jgi:hypothetical protein
MVRDRPRRVSRNLLLAVLALALLAVAGAAVLLMEHDSPELGRAALDRLGAASGLDLTAQGFRLSLLRGLEITGLEIDGELAAGHLGGTVGRIVLEHRPWSLLGGRLDVTELRIEEPRLTLGPRVDGPRETPPPGARPAASTAPPPPAPPAGSGSGRFTLAWAVEAVDVDGGRLELVQADGSATRLEGLRLAFEDLAWEPGAAGPTGRGSFELDELLLGTSAVRRAAGDLELGGGHLRSQEIAFELGSGPGRVRDLDVDLGTDPFTYQLQLLADPLDTNRLLLENPPEEGRFGPAHFELALAGRGAEPAAARGDGGLSVDTGTLPWTPIFDAIDDWLGGEGLVGSVYDPFTARFDVGTGRVVLAPFEIRAGKVLALSLEGGSYGLGDGALDLEISLRAPRRLFRGLDEIPDRVLDLLRDEEGRVVISAAVRGTVEAPRVVVDRQALERRAKANAADEARQKLEEKVSEGLQRLLGGRGDG